MSQCTRCGHLIAEPGKAYSYSGQFCHCGWAQEQIPQLSPKFGTPHDSTSVEEYKQRMMEKGNVQRPSFSHIINLCEQLTPEELGTLVKLLSLMHKSLAEEKTQAFVPNATSPYDVKGL